MCGNDLSSYLATRSTQFQWYLTEVKEATEHSQLTRESHLLGNVSIFFFLFWSAIVHQLLCLLQGGDVGINMFLTGCRNNFFKFFKFFHLHSWHLWFNLAFGVSAPLGGHTEVLQEGRKSFCYCQSICFFAHVEKLRTMNLYIMCYKITPYVTLALGPVEYLTVTSQHKVPV